jgi:hypothetical protein
VASGGFSRWLGEAFVGAVEHGGRAIARDTLEALNDQDLDKLKKLIELVQRERKSQVVDVKGE